MAAEDYVPVACDDWYQRRRQDAEGDFFRAVSDQGPRGKQNATRQGIYMLTAGGKLLAYKNAGQNADVMRQVLRDALEKWKKLPAAEREPGAVKVPDAGPLDGGYTRKPPKGGLIVNVHARALEKAPAAGGGVADAVCRIGDGDEASRDHLWITAEEWQAMAPAASAKVGDAVKVPPAVVERIARFHLIDNTRGEPPMWRKQDVKAADLAGLVEKVEGNRVVVKLEGKALLAEAEQVESAKRGFDAALLGYVTFDRLENRVERFDLVALGEHWGDGTYTRGARPGRTPFGVAFELARGDKPGDTVPPQAAREVAEYLKTGR